jgi:hypothetical protein
MINMVNINIIKQNVSKYKNGIKSTVNSINYGNVAQNLVYESNSNNGKISLSLSKNGKVSNLGISSTSASENGKRINLGISSTSSSENGKGSNSAIGLIVTSKNGKVSNPSIGSTGASENGKGSNSAIGSTSASKNYFIQKGYQNSGYYVPIGWNMIKVTGDGTCGYHAIMKYLELNDEQKYNEIIVNAQKIPIRSNISKENKPGFYFRKWLIIQIKSINKCLRTILIMRE